MKNIIYSILVCLPFVFGACDKSTDDTSKVTYFVTLERDCLLYTSDAADEL